MLEYKRRGQRDSRITGLKRSSGVGAVRQRVNFSVRGKANDGRWQWFEVLYGAAVSFGCQICHPKIIENHGSAFRFSG